MPISYNSAAKTACESSGWMLTNLELQKLLYLSHMKFLGVQRKPLIKNHFEAWKYGPVIPELYHKVKGFGDKPIQDVFNVDRNMKLSEHTIVRDVVDSFGFMSPGELVELTHMPGGAWDQYYGDGDNAIIPNSAIRAEYERDPF